MVQHKMKYSTAKAIYLCCAFFFARGRNKVPTKLKQGKKTKQKHVAKERNPAATKRRTTECFLKCHCLLDDIEHISNLESSQATVAQRSTQTSRPAGSFSSLTSSLSQCGSLGFLDPGSVTFWLPNWRWRLRPAGVLHQGCARHICIPPPCT